MWATRAQECINSALTGVSVGVYFAISAATVATATIESEKALNVRSLARCGCSAGCPEESQRNESLCYKNLLHYKLVGDAMLLE